jgi:predicted ferric reductase
MPFLIAIAVYAARIARRPVDVRLKKRHGGPLAAATIGIGLYLAWDRLRPESVGGLYFVGEFCGVGAVYLMTWALLLATRLRWLEQWFGGLDRMYLWHKQYALWSMLLIAVHIAGTQYNGGRIDPGTSQRAGTGIALGVVSTLGLLALVVVSLPQVGRILRASYERWLFLHRFIGLLVLIAVVHGWMLDPVITDSAPLMAAYLTIGAVGLAAYGYDELVLRRRAIRADYTVHRVARPAPDILDVTLIPTSPAVLPLSGGQFVYLRPGGERGWCEHPFSVAGTDPDGSVRLTIRALGAGTRRLYTELREGLPATLNGPFGMFDHTLGGPRQIWIAGGIGIAPFLGWLTHPSGTLPSTDLFYCVPDPEHAVFLPELTAAAEQNPVLRLHPFFSNTQGRLTADKIRDAAGLPATDTHVFLCGPAAMVEDLTRDLHRYGIPRHQIHAEHFAFR